MLDARPLTTWPCAAQAVNACVRQCDWGWVWVCRGVEGMRQPYDKAPNRRLDYKIRSGHTITTHTHLHHALEHVGHGLGPGQLEQLLQH